MFLNRLHNLYILFLLRCCSCFFFCFAFFCRLSHFYQFKIIHTNKSLDKVISFEIQLHMQLNGRDFDVSVWIKLLKITVLIGFRIRFRTENDVINFQRMKFCIFFLPNLLRNSIRRNVIKKKTYTHNKYREWASIFLLIYEFRTKIVEKHKFLFEFHQHTPWSAVQAKSDATAVRARQREG